MRRSSQLAVPLRNPDDVIPHLGKATHWKQGRSAKAIADSWFNADGIPQAVRAILAQAPLLARAELLEAWLERETDLNDGRGTASQSDLLGLLDLGDHLAVIGVEAKVDESFGPFVAAWLATGGDGKQARLASLCGMLGVEASAIGHLRYQLFHRTAAVLLEAKRFKLEQAVLVVQSFCPNATGLKDAVAFFSALGFVGVAKDSLVGPVNFQGIDLWVGWASDTCPTD